MKGKLLLLVCALIVLGSLVAGTAAYYTKDATATNVVTTGKIDLEIIEMTDSDTAFPESGIVVLPGATVSKIVTVKNTSGHPAHVRVQLSKFVSIKELTADFMDNGILTTDFNSEDWTVGDDGFIYYNDVLEPGKETSPVISEVYISGPKTDNKYRGADFTLKIDVYGVQSENNGTTWAEAAGWPSASDADTTAVFVPVID